MARPTSEGIRRKSFLAALLAFLAMWPGGSRAEAAQPGRVVMIIAGGISVRDLADPKLRNVRQLFENGAAGLMNVKAGKPTKDVEPAAKPGMLAGCLSLGAGAMASGGMEVARAYDATAPIGGVSTGGIYASRTGLDWSAANVLHTEIIKIQRVNAAAAYRAEPGALGSALRLAGIKTAVIGNSDTPNEIHHEAVAVAMDGTGKVDLGTVSSPLLTVPDADSAYGVRTDLPFMVGQIEAALGVSRFVVVDFGDTLRADQYCELCTDEQAMAIRARAARRLDELIGKIDGILDPRKDLLIVLSPCSRSFSEIDEERLAPIVVSGPTFPGGLLRSPSTRRTGVVTISDIAPTVLDFFGLDPSDAMTGRPIEVAPASNTMATLLELNLDAANHAQRLAAMRGGSVFQSIIVVLATLGLVLVRSPRWRRIAVWAAVVPVIIPIAMLFATPIYSGGLVGSVAVLVALVALMLGLAIVILRTPARALAWMCGLLVVGLTADLALGAPLTKWSIAGYSLTEGARYYGIGNELMGSMVGAVLVCVGLIFAGGRIPPKARTVFAGFAFALVFVVISAPALGAKAGGAIVASLGFVTALAARRGWRPTMRGLVLVILIAGAAAIGMFALDMGRGGSTQSHTGRALGLAMSGDAGGILSIVERKLQLNFMLVYTSLWSRLLGLSLACSGVLYWLSRLSAGKPDQKRELSAATAGLIVGTAAAFLFNDSGVLAAAGCAVIMWSMLAICLEQAGGVESEPGSDKLAPRF